MAPSTRLRDRPERRIEYREVTRVGTRANPIEVDEDTPPPPARRAARTAQTARKSTGATTRAKAAASRTRAGRALVPDRQSPETTISRVDAGAVVRPKAPVKKAGKAPAKEKKLPPPKRECSVCVSTKSISHSFRLDKNDGTCEHFKSICSQCVTKMIAGKIESRQLGEAGLACPYSGCDHVLDHADLKMVFTNKEKFKEYDAALAKHFLAANPNFIACLSSKCGKYFSTEDCSVNDKTEKPEKPTASKTKTKGSKSTDSSSDPPAKPQKIDCPYCNSSLCLTCNRPWHVKSLCSAAAALEDASSVASIKALGAKPCPKCGINIEKLGGCDHMTCHRCRHNFCWQCLVPYTSTVAHAEGCSHGRRDVAVDPRNWVPENLTDAQVNEMIEHMHERLDEPGLDVHPLAQNQGGPDFAGPQRQNMLLAAANLVRTMFRGPGEGI